MVKIRVFKLAHGSLNVMVVHSPSLLFKRNASFPSSCVPYNLSIVYAFITNYLFTKTCGVGANSWCTMFYNLFCLSNYSLRIVPTKYGTSDSTTWLASHPLFIKQV
jgi:hypothetical protein